MWQCTKCREKLDDEFEVCWNCGTSKDGVEDPNFRRAEDAGPEDSVESFEAEESTAIRTESERHVSQGERRENPPLDCPRCRRALKFVGTKSFHEGFQWGGLFGDFGEFFVNREDFDVYVCPRCGRVEFYVSGLGEELRPPKDAE